MEKGCVIPNRTRATLTRADVFISLLMKTKDARARNVMQLLMCSAIQSIVPWTLLYGTPSICINVLIN